MTFYEFALRKERSTAIVALLNIKPVASKTQPYHSWLLIIVPKPVLVLL